MIQYPSSKESPRSRLKMLGICTYHQCGHFDRPHLREKFGELCFFVYVPWDGPHGYAWVEERTQFLNDDGQMLLFFCLYHFLSIIK